jgi:hypothetical protein
MKALAKAQRDHIDDAHHVAAAALPPTPFPLAHGPSAIRVIRGVQNLCHLADCSTVPYVHVHF